MTTEKITTYGGVLIKGNDVLFDFSNTSVAFETLSSVSIEVECQVSDKLIRPDDDLSHMAYVLLAIYVDGKEIERRTITRKTPEKERKLSFKCHQQVRIIKLSEAYTGIVCLKDLMEQKIKSIPKEEKVKVEFIGDSLTSGYGNDGGNDCILDTDWLKTWGSHLCNHFNWEAMVHSYSCMGLVRDSSDDRNQQITERRRRILGSDASTVFDFSTFPASIVIINIGTNDMNGSRFGKAISSEYKAKMEELITELLGQYGNNVKIILVHGPMMTEEPRRFIDSLPEAFKHLSTNIAVAQCQLPMFRFFWGTFSHPNAFGHKTMADQLIPQIEKILQ